MIPLTPALARALSVPTEFRGVVVNEASLPADLRGFQAGDVVTQVENSPTPDLLSFVQATELVRDLRQANVAVYRGGALQNIPLVALMARLGTANGETPPTIQPGALPPHRYAGPCSSCHRIADGRP